MARQKSYLFFVSSIRLSRKHNANDVQQEEYANSNNNSNIPSLSKAGKSNKNFFEVNIIRGRKELASEWGQVVTETLQIFISRVWARLREGKNEMKERRKQRNGLMNEWMNEWMKAREKEE